MFHLINFIDFSKYSISKYAYSEFDAVNAIQTSWDFLFESYWFNIIYATLYQ